MKSFDYFSQNDDLHIAGINIKNRFFLGTGKFSSNQVVFDIIQKCGVEVLTLALRRADIGSSTDNLIDYIPSDCILMPNTAGARNAEEAILIARLSKAMGCGDWIKLEVIPDNKYLMPDNFETIKATETLAKEGFKVFPYMNPDLIVAKKLEQVGAVAIMPLASPIGSNRGLKTKEMIKILISGIDLPIIVDAGIGKPSDATIAMELGVSVVLINTAVAISENPVCLAEAFDLAIKAGRKAFLSGLTNVKNSEYVANASTPLLDFSNNNS